MIQCAGNFVRMLILILSRSSSKLGHVRSKTRSLGQILEKLCVHSRVHSFVQMSWHFVRRLIIIISRSDLKLGHVGSKTRLLGQQATQVSDLGPLWPSCLTICSVRTCIQTFSPLSLQQTIRIYAAVHGMKFYSVISDMHKLKVSNS